MKIVTNGETTVAEIIPIGLKEPKILSEIGAVNVWAAVAAESDELAARGKILE